MKKTSNALIDWVLRRYSFNEIQEIAFLLNKAIELVIKEICKDLANSKK